jgi:hypothetical protein
MASLNWYNRFGVGLYTLPYPSSGLTQNWPEWPKVSRDGADKKIGDTRLQLAIVKEVLPQLEAAQEIRSLTP